MPDSAGPFWPDRCPEVLNVKSFKRKSVSLYWEMMFTRSLFSTSDMVEQGKLLNEMAALVDAGRTPRPKQRARSMRRHCGRCMRRAKAALSGARLCLKGFHEVRSRDESPHAMAFYRSAYYSPGLVSSDFRTFLMPLPNIPWSKKLMEVHHPYDILSHRVLSGRVMDCHFIL